MLCSISILTRALNYRKMEEELLARETMDIWENIEDMMEEEFEDCSSASAAAPAPVDPELKEARIRFQLKLNEKTRQLERVKTLLEETTTTLENLKRLKCFDVEDEDWEIRCLEEQIEVLKKEKQRKKRAVDETSQLFKDSFSKVPNFLSFDDEFMKILEKNTIDVKVSKDTVKGPKDDTDTNKPKPLQ